MRRESARWTSLQSIRQSSRGCEMIVKATRSSGDGLFNVASSSSSSSSLDIRDEDVAFEGRPPNQNSISRSRRRQNAQARFSRRLHGPTYDDPPLGHFCPDHRLVFNITWINSSNIYLYILKKWNFADIFFLPSAFILCD